MKNNLINEFLRLLESNKRAIISKGEIKTYRELGHDIKRMITVFEKNTNLNDSILIFSYPYRYDFYVSMFAGLLSGRTMVILDSFKDKKKTEYMLNEANCNICLSDKLFKYFKFKLPKLKMILSSDYKKEEESSFIADSAKVITFTSSTTGLPKRIERDLSFLEGQLNMLKNNLSVDDSSIIYGILPMYTLLSIFLGHTTVIDRKPNRAKDADTVIAPIKKLINIKKPMNNIKHVFMGGAILYRSEASYLNKIFPNAQIDYVYGASEGALIYKTTLANYLNNIFIYDEPTNGIDVSIDNPNLDGVGVIKIEGNTVIGKTHLTGDLGKLIENRLMLYGRAKYSDLDKGFYNYLMDQEIRDANPNIKAFSFKYNDKIICVYNGKLINKNDNIKYIYLKNLPYDIKHKTKLDYGKTIKILEGNKLI